MSFWKIAWRSIEQRALASSLTGLSMALGVALIILVLVIHNVFVGQLSNDAQGYDLIIGGGQGSRFEVVLTSVFHVGKPLIPFPYSYYKKFVGDGEFAPYVEAAVPICLGDSYQAEDGRQFRVVGTIPEYFTAIPYGLDDDGEELNYEFREGRNFRRENFFEAVLGSVAANRTGLKVGDRFQPTHGIAPSDTKHDAYEVVGILEPTGTSTDRAVFINMEGFYLGEGHAMPVKKGEEPPADEIDQHRADGPRPLPESQREVTSILVRSNPDLPTSAMYIEGRVMKGDERIAQVVTPRPVVNQIATKFLDPVRLVLLVLTVLIVVVAGISVLVSIYNSMSERSHDIAVMRALGASRTAVMGIILVESILLSLLGAAAGILLGHLVLAAASPVVENYTGIAVRPWDFTWQELLLAPGLVAFASLVGLLPALTAYRTDVARTLGGAR